jgi:hypothetical protein
MEIGNDLTAGKWYRGRINIWIDWFIDNVYILNFDLKKTENPEKSKIMVSYGLLVILFWYIIIMNNRS